VSRESRVVQQREVGRAAPDPRLIALLRLLARHAARQDHDESLRASSGDGNAGESAPENAS
jgi:hypothetical protein